MVSQGSPSSLRWPTQGRPHPEPPYPSTRAGPGPGPRPGCREHPPAIRCCMGEKGPQTSPNRPPWDPQGSPKVNARCPQGGPSGPRGCPGWGWGPGGCGMVFPGLPRKGSSALATCLQRRKNARGTRLPNSASTRGRATLSTSRLSSSTTSTSWKRYGSAASGLRTGYARERRRALKHSTDWQSPAHLAPRCMLNQPKHDMQ